MNSEVSLKHLQTDTQKKKKKKEELGRVIDPLEFEPVESPEVEEVEEKEKEGELGRVVDPLEFTPAEEGAPTTPQKPEAEEEPGEGVFDVELSESLGIGGISMLKSLSQLPRFGNMLSPNYWSGKMANQILGVPEQETGKKAAKALEGLVNKMGVPEKEHPLPPAKNLTELFSPRRLIEGGIENLPLMVLLMASYLKNPVLGQGLMAGVEGGEALKSIDEWEERTGNELPPGVREIIGGGVGLINMSLEKLGIEQFLKLSGGKALLSRFKTALIQVPIEGKTEFIQEWTQILAEAGYQGGKDVLTNLWDAIKEPMNLVRSTKAGLTGLMGATGIAGTSMAGAELGKSERALTPEELEAKKPPEQRTAEELEQIGVKEDLPDLRTSDQARGYGALKIEDKDVDAWREEILARERMRQEARQQNVNPFTVPPEDAFDLEEGKSFTAGRTHIKNIRGKASVGDVFAALEKRGVGRSHKPILDRLKEILPLDSPVYRAESITPLEKEGEVSGIYYPTNNLIFFNDFIFREQIESENISTILHELSHFATSVPFMETRKARKENREPKLSKKEKEFVDRVEHLQTRAGLIADEAFREGTELAPSTIRRIGNALKDPAELIGYGINDPDVRNFLDTLEIETREGKVKHAWSEVVDAIREFFGLSEDKHTVLNELLQVTEEYTRTRVLDEVEMKKETDLLKQALSAKLGMKVSYNNRTKELIERPFEIDEYERVIRSISKEKAEGRITWARKQIDQSDWLKWFAGYTPPPVEFDVNKGEEIRRMMLEDEGLSPDMTDEELSRVDYKKSKHVGFLGQHLLSPEYTLRPSKKGAIAEITTDAQRVASNLIKAEMELNQRMSAYYSWLTKLRYNTSKEERVAVRSAMKSAYVLRDPNSTPAGVSNAKQNLAEIYGKHPRVERMVEGVDHRGGVIEIFEYVKQREREKRRKIKRLKLSDLDNRILDTLLAKETRIEEEAMRQVRAKYNLDKMARKEAGLETWGKKTAKQKAKKIDTIAKREVRRIMGEVNDIKEIDSWGLPEYITSIEVGSYRVVDQDGNILGFGKNVKEAKKKAFRIRKEMEERGEEVRKLDIEPSLNRIKPTVPTKGILAGEEDIFEALPRYIYAMEKRIVIDPVVQEYKSMKKKNPKAFPAGVSSIIQEQINYVKGGKYSWGDQVADKISFAYGWETGKYTKYIQRIRKTMANLLLGYRVSASAVNLMGGFGHTWVAVGNRFFTDASKSIRSGTYTTPSGETINMKEKLKEVEERGGLAIDFSITAEGEIRTRIPIWKPLGGFQFPETKIRPHNFAANYIYQREVLGKNDQEATEAATYNLRFQQFSYNLAAIPHILRSPGGRLIGQFKTYFAKEAEFISTLRGKQLARMVGLQLMMAGPRGVVYMLKTIPVLGALGLLDDAEEWLVRGKGLVQNMLSRGIAGAIGADISAPAVLQLPHSPEAFGGPFIGAMYRLFDKVIIPSLQSASAKVAGDEGPAYLTDRGIDWVTSLSPLLYYLEDLEQSVLAWGDSREIVREMSKFDVPGAAKTTKGMVEKYIKNYQKPDVWIRDSEGNKAYKIGGLQDRLLLLGGIAPVEKTQYSVIERIWKRDRAVMKENRSRWYSKVTKRLLQGREITEDLWSDATLYMVDPSYIPRSYKFKQMAPQEREALKARLFERADAIEHFGLE